LLNYESDITLAGGISLNVLPQAGYHMNQGEFYLLTVTAVPLMLKRREQLLAEVSVLWF
jgi:hypothetical protein